ncbi:cation:proton antiporter [Paenibacillus sp. TRM 82003]|uniref:cation:proton antiporter n=1 Tax=Kineococcus sp. TRM81007 TaxID=2925831 RepID=UPI001F597F3A|nr:cation:proton antiporter [Kineococcus sp. TRM81007]MCI2238509.1 cation:proton antiporter [Kineococcus sp. TRM81007]MCI3921978.1 cation:proton antiporter [Paenibacillus sp. TRM 82003]
MLYALLFTIAGASALLAALLPRVIERLPVNLPMAFLALGVLLGLVPGLPPVDPMAHESITEHVTEIVVIISLMGAGLAIDRPFGWRRWASTWRLVAIAMPLTIALVALTGSALAGLPLAAAVLLGAVLAPTDPVLASDVQVGEPADDPTTEDEVRFALTSEAGLNDGATFPVVHLAVVLATAGATATALGGWALEDLLLRSVVGLVSGLVIGRVLGALFFRSRLHALRLADDVEGFTALAVTFLAYGVTEMLHGYGFVAVFVAAHAIRSAERSHGAHRVAHGFVEQVERMLTAWLLLLLGAALSDGLLRDLTWQLALTGVLLVLVIRPLVGWLSLLGTRAGPRERWVIGVYGVRGIGSLFYLSWALAEGEFPAGPLWAAVGFTIALSVVVHGATAAPVVQRLDARRLLRARSRGSADIARTHV